MSVEMMIEKGKTAKLTYEELRTLVANRAVFGADVLQMLTTQSDLRKDEAQGLRDQSQDRELKASEQRTFDRALNESQMIQSLAREVEQRTEQRAHVPVTQTTIQTEASGRSAFPAALTREQPVAKWLQQRGGFA